MARGGYRPGAGRPRKADRTPAPPKRERTATPALVQTPLDYMLGVMNDPGADDARRDRMAIAAAPYLHGRGSDRRPGKKEEAQAAAQTAEQGTAWDGLLN